MAFAIVVAATGCDRTETHLTVNADGSGEWDREIVFADDGAWVADFDALRNLADEHLPTTGGPDGFVAAALPLFFPDLEGEGGTLAEIDKRLTTEFGLMVDTAPGEVIVRTSDQQSDFRNVISEFALPGEFIRDDSGNHFYRVDNAVAVLLEVPGAGSIGTTGLTIFEMDVAGDVLSHNAHEVDGRTMRWTWDPENEMAVEADSSDEEAAPQGQILVHWDPNGDGEGDALTPSSSALRRYGYLAIAALALVIGTAVLLTFKTDSFDDELLD